VNKSYKNTPKKSAKNFVTIGFLSAILLLIGMLVIFAGILWKSYNTLAIKEEKVSEAWAQVESNLQRKADLLPNLVKTVKAYAEHEQDLLTEVTGLRADSMKALEKIQSESRVSSKEVRAAQELNKRIDTSVMRLFAAAEGYPELRSSEHFLQLQAQLEGAENRINITRMHFNSSVSDFNAYSKTMPANMVAAMAGFEQKAYFTAQKRAEDHLDLDL
jgi:LemA protein